MRQVETIVIGGGIAGLSAAARFAQHGEVVVLEGEDHPGYHASGRSVAYLHFGLGDRLVRALTAMSLEALSSDGDTLVRRHPALHIVREDETALLDALEDSLRSFGADYERVGPERIAGIVPVLDIGEGGFREAILERSALKLDTDAMLQAHVRALNAAGGALECRARVERIASAGNRWQIDTSGASYSAARVVNAAGAWADEIADIAGVSPIGISPLRRTVIQFAAPDGVDVSPWPFVKTVGEGFYVLPEGSTRLLASPMDETPSEPCDAAPEELDIAIVADRVMQATSLDIRRIEHSWAGLRSFAPDKHPVVGYDPAAPGFFWLAGQGGFGFQTSPALAAAAEALLFGLDWPEELAALGVTVADIGPARFAR
ncbi:NAD(P)/FAD-dependent oxidoreductase [Tsuneonella mangrovi]|uniref:NAD(P)/FAD-dependent oxidoreductase n=1 Tax=Tsuneonella mangrovi TaxID=1982042 RepID=UPI000BA1CDA7|nr:FAD-dependent oxidoreductase [Tsuneonella mangrovi]